MKKKFCVLLIVFETAAEVISVDTYDSFKRVSAPYAYSFQSPSGQTIDYIGTCHTSDPTHPQYATLNNRWKKFLEHKAHNPVTIVEAAHVGDYTSQETALAKATDCGYATWLSSQHDVPLIAGELTHKAVIQQLLQEFTKDEVYYFAFAQAVSFALRTQAASLEQYVLQQVTAWTNDSTITFSELTALHKTFTGLPFEPRGNFFFPLNDLSYHTSFLSGLLYSFTLPRSVAKKFYPLLRRSFQIRDNHTLNIITEQWNLKKNIFVVYGAHHAATLEQPLKKLTQIT